MSKKVNTSTVEKVNVNNNKSNRMKIIEGNKKEKDNKILKKDNKKNQMNNKQKEKSKNTKEIKKEVKKWNEKNTNTWSQEYYQKKINKKPMDNKIVQNITNRFLHYAYPEQDFLKSMLYGELKEYFQEENIINQKGFLFVKGNIPVLLTAHMDTVHNQRPRKINIEYKNGYTYISSKEGIGGDDRCGIYIIMELLKMGYKPYVLFCEDEESGGIGSSEFCDTNYITDLYDLKYLIELDRANDSDAVFYNCNNDDFEQFIKKITGYCDAWGTFSDISFIAPECGVAAVNLSCGYYKAHTVDEYVIIEEMWNTLTVTEKLLLEAEKEEVKAFEYIEYNGNSYYSNYSKYLYNGNDDYSDYYKSNRNYYESCYGYSSYGYKNHYNTGKTSKVYDQFVMTIYYERYDYEQKIMIEENCTVYGETKNDCIAKFLTENSNICWNDVLDYDISLRN